MLVPPDGQFFVTPYARYRRADRLRIGAPAPDFELVRLDSPGSAERVRLSSFRGERPVVLFFGSYT